jgi:hypothetical protein
MRQDFRMRPTAKCSTADGHVSVESKGSAGAPAGSLRPLRLPHEKPNVRETFGGIARVPVDHGGTFVVRVMRGLTGTGLASGALVRSNGRENDTPRRVSSTSPPTSS